VEHAALHLLRTDIDVPGWHPTELAALYISATPTRNTVDAYLHLGAMLADPPDPYLLALEPDDIHLILALGFLSRS
jgi:hypothetical protein